jgi:DNA-binding MarR family transcriptional regulator
VVDQLSRGGPVSRFRQPGGPHPPAKVPPRPNVGWLMKEAVYYARKAVDKAVRAHGVSVSQWSVLYQLAEQPGLSGAELARTMLLTPQAAHQALTTLERMGLIERKPDPNHARIFRAALTDDGRRTAERCRADSQRIQRAMVAGFDEDEKAMLIDLLERFLHRAKAEAGTP